MKSLMSRLPLRLLVFLILLLAGIIPLAVSSWLLVRQNRDILETQEKSYLTRSAQFLSVELSGLLSTARGQLAQLGETMESLQTEGGVEEQLASPWLKKRVAAFLDTHSNFLALRVMNREGSGPQFAVPISADAVAALKNAFESLGDGERPVYRFVPDGGTGSPAAVVALAVGEARDLVLEGVVEISSLGAFFREQAQGDVGVFLIDRSDLQRLSVSQIDRHHHPLPVHPGPIHSHHPGRFPLFPAPEPLSSRLYIPPAAHAAQAHPKGR